MTYTPKLYPTSIGLMILQARMKMKISVVTTLCPNVSIVNKSVLLQKLLLIVFQWSL